MKEEGDLTYCTVHFCSNDAPDWPHSPKALTVRSFLIWAPGSIYTSHTVPWPSEAQYSLSPPPVLGLDEKSVERYEGPGLPLDPKASVSKGGLG